MNRIIPFFVLSLAILAGCNGKTSTAVYDGQGNPVNSTKPEGNDPKEVQKPKPLESEVPASLKTAAYEYFGFGNEATMDVELRVKGQPTKTGGVTMKLSKIDGETATYDIERTGAIADDLGNEKVLIDSTGVYSIENSTATVTPAKNLILPTDLTVGKTWPSKTKVVRNDGQELEENSSFKVVGEQDVTTKKGSQKALLVTSSGTALVKVGGKQEKAQYDTKSWYVKGRGPVKLEITLTLTGKPSNSVIVEETK